MLLAESAVMSTSRCGSPTASATSWRMFERNRFSFFPESALPRICRTCRNPKTASNHFPKVSI
jgi:hypothetical protein